MATALKVAPYMTNELPVSDQTSQSEQKEEYTQRTGAPVTTVVESTQLPLLYNQQPIGTTHRYGSVRETGDIESNNHPISYLSFDEKSIRRAFIRKVFIILAIQLSIVTGLVALFVFHVVFIISYFAMALGANVRRRFPGNMACLFLLTISMGYILASIASFHDVREITIALIITVVACLAVVAFTLQPKYDFMGMLALTYVFSTTFIIFAIITLIASLIFYIPILFLIYCGIAAILFMMYLSIDVYMIVGGQRPEISPEDYTFAAVQVFLDIVNIFLLILILIGGRR